MKNKFKELPADLQSQIVYQFKSDYFFHYLMHRSDRIRLFFCCYLSHDDSITSTKTISNEILGNNADSKKFILDVVAKDNKGRVYNLEMQNYNFNQGEEIRMMQYLESLIQMQINKGIKYEDIKEAYQMVIYTGKPYQEFQNYIHEIKKGDIKRQLQYEGDKGNTLIYQLEKLEEEINMEAQLTTMNQFMYLFKHNDIEGEVDDLVKEAIEMHNEYIADEKEIIKALEAQRERLTLSSRIHYAKEEGKEEGLEEGIEIGKEQGLEQGKKLELLNNVKFIIESIYHTKEYDWLDDCTYEQLQQALTLAFKGYSYEEFIVLIKSLK